MKRISPVLLSVLALAGAAAGFLLDHAMTTAGRATFTPSILLSIFLVLLALAVLALAWPIRRSTRSPERPPVNPFRALRIATLARASSLVGAAITGFAVGLMAYLLSRPITPPLGSIIATAVAALVLTIAAVIAESFCLLPGNGPHDPDGLSGPRLEDDDDDHPRTAADPGH
ncbi:MAG: hypothetical protein B7X41_12765 [Microbacterium sp. 14-71-5]|jgi:MFS family permease|uniref:DUF3180 domain-containing protein n=1 Tax=Microbacterium sp. 13-71-7 TaxID=1970399 RepID=UPI000BD0AA87|nr:DUF3180 domain-containing protein [Microbacterium sp. 13-71-7]OZB85039.1 MAG: hypothetical protein B7X32_05045 [Microbacterium sp. 13-71-7]OZB87532.1 MAG: hypothetical protein B7X41_12765 [Microbacterium sp. 14-71-5]